MATNSYDAIVVGGGHNGLTNGAYLAKAGLRTLILERRHLVGGAVACVTLLMRHECVCWVCTTILRKERRSQERLLSWGFFRFRVG